MENRTEFDLIKSVDIWKMQLSKNPNMTTDNVEELESHLLDEIDELEHLGLSTEESLLVAQNRIGDIEQLIAEYNKVNRNVYFKNQVLPYLNSMLLFIAFWNIMELMVHLSTLVAFKIGISEGYLSLISIVLLILSTISIIGLIYTKYKRGDWMIQSLKNIPLLIATITISKLLFIKVMNTLSSNIGYHKIGIIQVNLGAYKMIVILLILIVSCILFYGVRKSKKMKIVE